MYSSAVIHLTIQVRSRQTGVDDHDYFPKVTSNALSDRASVHYIHAYRHDAPIGSD